MDSCCTSHALNHSDFLIIQRLQKTATEQYINWYLFQVVDCSSPLAWKAGTPFGIVAEVSLQNLALMTTAFMENRLILDDMLELSQMLSELKIVFHFKKNHKYLFAFESETEG